jgi:membrane protease YdiL (CAAX protease family)
MRHACDYNPVTSIARTAIARDRSLPLLRAAFLLAGLAAATLARAALNGQTVASALLAGTGLGIALLAISALAGWRPGRPALRSVPVGLAGGAILLLLPRLIGSGVVVRLGIAPEPMAAWLAVTILVAAAEEVLLRGALVDALAEGLGFTPALVVSSIAFGLMHVPLYGWGVLPADAAAGIWLLGLRLAGGGLGAPVVAHAMVDIATWWL